MNKLINKFKLFSEDPIASAEECKKIAINFNYWIHETNAFGYVDEEMFNKFIEEEYGK